MNEGANIVKGRNNNQVVLDKNGGIATTSGNSLILINSQTPPQSPISTPSSVTSTYNVPNLRSTGSLSLTESKDVIPSYYPTQSTIPSTSSLITDTSSFLLPEIEEVFITQTYENFNIVDTSIINTSEVVFRGAKVNVTNQGFLCDFTGKSYYTDKPIVPYKKTYYSKVEAVRYLKANVKNPNIAKAVFATMWSEQGAGDFLSNSGAYNHFGFQTDSGRWDSSISKLIVGRTGLREGGTNKCREFAVFESSERSLDVLAIVLQSKGFGNSSDPDKFARLRLNTYIFFNLEKQNLQEFNRRLPLVKAEYNTAIAFYNSH
jgi:hypothetical protein